MPIFSGAGAIWHMDSGTYVASNETGDAAGLALAKAISGGIVQIGPGLEALVLGTFGANISIIRITNTGQLGISRLRILDGTDPTKQFFLDPAAITTGTTRTATLPDYSGLLVLPATLGNAGEFLRSGGAGVQPTWATVTLTNTLLDGANHTDTVAQTVSRGSLIYGNTAGTPKWDELTIGSSGSVLYSNGTDPSWTALSTLQSHDLLPHIQPFSVTNCNWANGSANITHASGGLANVKVGDRLFLGTNESNPRTGAFVTVWTDSNNITVNRTNTDPALTNQTFVFVPGDHWNDTVALDTGTGAGYFLTTGRGTYNTGNTSGTFQEIRGPVRWTGQNLDGLQTDFRVMGWRTGGTPEGFSIWFSSSVGAYFDVKSLTSTRTYKFPNVSGDFVITGGAQTVDSKTLSSGNKIVTDGTSTYTLFQSAALVDRLGFNLASMTALRSVSWPDFAGRATVEGAAVTFANADTTPSVALSRLFKTNNAGATSITTFDDGVAGQEITVIIGDANTTLVDGATLVLAGSVNWTPASTDTWTGVYDGSVWYEKCRSDNT